MESTVSTVFTSASSGRLSSIFFGGGAKTFLEFNTLDLSLESIKNLDIPATIPANQILIKLVILLQRQKGHIYAHRSFRETRKVWWQTNFVVNYSLFAGYVGCSRKKTLDLRPAKRGLSENLQCKNGQNGNGLRSSGPPKHCRNQKSCWVLSN